MRKKIVLTPKEVKHIAKLANLKLTSVEIKKFANQLSDVLSYVEQLNKLDVQKLKPTSQVTGLENITREDKPRPSLSQEEVLSAASEKYNNFFKIKAIF